MFQTACCCHDWVRKKYCRQSIALAQDCCMSQKTNPFACQNSRRRHQFDSCCGCQQVASNATRYRRPWALDCLGKKMRASPRLIPTMKAKLTPRKHPKVSRKNHCLGEALRMIARPRWRKLHPKLFHSTKEAKRTQPRNTLDLRSLVLCAWQNNFPWRWYRAGRISPRFPFETNRRRHHN